MTDPVARARALAPDIAKRAAEFETERRLPKDVAMAMADAGLYRLAVPRTVGGAEAAPATIVEVLETIAEADASAAWCLMIGITTGINAAYLPQTLARSMYGDPHVITGGVFAPLGKAISDGPNYIVTGRWAWGSGTQNARWIVGGSIIMEGDKPRLGKDGAPVHRMMIFDAKDVTFHDTWHVMGLNGTGSVDFSVDKLLVPQARSVSLLDDKPREQGPLYHFPAFGLLALGIASVALGNARAALAAFRDLAATKKPAASKRTLSERAYTQLVYAEACAAHAGARAFVYDAVQAAWSDAQYGRPFSLERRAALRLACTHATRACAELCRNLYDLAGGPAVYAGSALQRRFRDAHVMIQHMMVAPATLEVAGRALLGLPTDDAML